MNLVMISLDSVWGADWELLLQRPNIGPLLRRGLRCSRVQTVYPTITYPIHVSMITGKEPRDHGILHNHFFDPACENGLPADFAALLKKHRLPADAHRPWHWDHRDIRVETLFDACHREKKSVCSILWPITGKHRGIRWNFPEVLAMPWESQPLKMLRYGSPWWVLSTEARLGKHRVSSHEPDLSDYAVTLAEDRLRRKKIPALTAIHLVDCDAMRHLHGVYSTQAVEALDRLDRLVGRIINALKEGGHEADTCLLLVSDHGQEDVDICVELQDHLQDFHVRVQSLGRGAYIHMIPGYEHEKPLIKAHLRTLPFVANIFDEPLLAVDGVNRVVFTDQMANARHEKATHGFGADHTAAKCILSLTGPGVEDEEKAYMHITDIASLCARILGLNWRPSI